MSHSYSSTQTITMGKGHSEKMHDWLVLPHADTAIAMAGFILKNTLPDNGGVTRKKLIADGVYGEKVDVLNACVGAKIEVKEGEEAIDVCLAIQTFGFFISLYPAEVNQ